MVSGGVLVEGREIRLSALTFVADDSTWLQEAPLDVDVLPVCGLRTFEHAAVASFCGSRRLSIGRFSCHPPSQLPTGVSAPVGRGFSGG